MAQPSLADVHADERLTDFSSAAFIEPGAFAWRQFTSLKPVDKQSNKYPIFDRGDFFRSEAKSRAAGTPSARRDFKLSDATYYCDRKSIAQGISEMEAANADPGIDLEETVAAVLAQDLNIAAEIDMATAFLNTDSVWATDKTVTTQWNDAASDVMGDIATGLKTVAQAIGRRPNVALCGADVFYDGLLNNEDILARLSNDSVKVPGEADIARIFGIDKLLVTSAPYTTSQEGLTDAFGFIGGKHLVLAYVDPMPGLRSPTAAAAFQWNGLLGAAPSGIRTKRMVIPQDDLYPLIESDTALDFKVVSSVAGYRFSSVVA